MASLVHQTSHDPLPLYTPQQAGTCASETSSILSSAPSYTSDVPSYHSSASRRPSAPESAGVPERVEVQRSSLIPVSSNQSAAPRGLPRLEYAPGFRRPRNSLSRGRNDLYSGDPSQSESSSLPYDTFDSDDRDRHLQRTTSGPSRGRPALALTLHSSRQPIGTGISVNRLSTQNSNLQPIPRSDPRSNQDNASIQTHNDPNFVNEASGFDDDIPISPYEDPELVGPEAAAIARNRRLYIANVKRGIPDEEFDAMKVNEAKTWDHMIAQMADWEERDRNWRSYKSGLSSERRRPLGARLGSRRP